jgi:serine phosphatase RsbU (regulator of sigma subunit)
MEVVNAGHVVPYVARGQQATGLDLPANVPLGLFRDTTFRTRHLDLEPGDRMVFLTDGMLERNADSVDLPAAILETRPLHPREAVRALADRVLDATGDTLSDDATVLCLDWHGGHGRARASIHGAERRRASEPLD